MRTLPCFAVLWVATAAHAGPPPETESYAIVVGSNQGGPGQANLRFAEDDARRVAEVLADVGGYDPRRIVVVGDPTPDRVMAAVDEIGGAVAADAAAGRRSLVFFYYSGHARATALNLGAAELPLARLRQRLVKLPATLTVVVLDACQSGAFSRVKGAEPASDFSYNSRAGLSSTGIAVMASSSASELSQESDALQSSYFTNHLLAALRGAGDTNGDGRVSLDEAYRYAYNQTLLATAQTAIGAQHASLEVELRGQGEVALSYPEKASAHIALDDRLAGDVFVERLPGQSVVAELSKAKGGGVRIAVAPGVYRVLVHHDGVVERCPVVVAAGATATLASCETAPEIDAAAKGSAAIAEWQLELVFAIGGGVDDQFIQRLRDFGYTRQLGSPLQLGLVGFRRIFPYLAAGLEVDDLREPEWHRGTDTSPLVFEMHTITAALAVRAGYPLSRRLSVFAQANLGASLGRDQLTAENGMSTTDSYWSWNVAASGGVTWMPWTAIGASLRATYVHAPAVANLIGDTHDGGGLFVGVALEVRP